MTKLKVYATVLEAIDPATEELAIWTGLEIEAESQEAAQRWAIENGFGYLQVVGEVDTTAQTEAALINIEEDRQN